MNDDARKKYADIIDLPHHISSNRAHMSLYDRAAQFAPFAALSGYDDMVREEARLTDEDIGLSEYQTEILNMEFALINRSLCDGDIPFVAVTCFIPDDHKEGGRFEKIKGMVKELDVTARKLILYGSSDIRNRRIPPVVIDLDMIRNIEKNPDTV